MERKGMKVDCLTVGPFSENCYIISNGNGSAVIIDPGDEEDSIISFIRKNKLSPKVILATHAHLDHVGAVHALKEEYKIPFYLNAGDIPLLNSLKEQARLFGFSFGEIPKVDSILNGDNALDIGGFSIIAIHTPGHTQGGTCYKFDDVLFAGDTLFQGSIGRTDLPGGNFNQLIESITGKLVTLDGDTIVHCGHGADTTIKTEKKNNPFILDPGRYRGLL